MTSASVKKKDIRHSKGYSAKALNRRHGKTLTNVCEKGLRLVVDETKKTMNITRNIPLSEIADLTILREAQRELGNK